jgi:putative lipoic acid-binding regulatory protein
MEDVFLKLRIQLELEEWPNVYMFKFIVPNEPELLAQTTALFTEEAEMSLHPSSTGKYISVSAKELMMDVDSIIARYVEASKIKGIISL